MVESTIHIGGGTVFWSIGEWSSREQIKEGLLDLGLVKYVPEPRTPAAALKDALGEVFTLPTQLMRPLKAKDGFTVVEEQRGVDTNGYATLLTAKIDKDLRIHTDPYSSSQSGDLVNRFNKHLGLLRAANVAACMVTLLDSLGGTRLRPQGSIYWLPDHKLDDWLKVVEVIEKAGVGRNNNVYLLRNLMDHDAVRALRDAIVSEVQREAGRIAFEVQSGDLGEKALETRKEQAVELRQKIQLYEDIPGVGLKHLTDAVDKADNAACAAALTLSVAGGLVEAGA